MIILPSNVGIIVSQYTDPYQPMSIMECHLRILGMAPEDLVVYFLITQNSQCLSLGIKASSQISSSRQGSRRICFGRKHVSHDVSPILFVVNSDI